MLRSIIRYLFNPKPREVIYGLTAYRARLEVLDVKIRHQQTLNKMWRVPLNSEEWKRLLEQATSIENELDEIEQRYFGPEDPTTDPALAV